MAENIMELSIKNEIIRQRLLEGGVTEDEVNKIFEGMVEETKKEEDIGTIGTYGVPSISSFCQYCGHQLQTITFPKNFDVTTGKPCVGYGCTNKNCSNSSIHRCTDNVFSDCVVCGKITLKNKSLRIGIWIFFGAGIVSTMIFGTIAIVHYIF